MVIEIVETRDKHDPFSNWSVIPAIPLNLKVGTVLTSYMENSGILCADESTCRRSCKATMMLTAENPTCSILGHPRMDIKDLFSIIT
jgi:hypothetical protein